MPGLDVDGAPPQTALHPMRPAGDGRAVHAAAAEDLDKSPEMTDDDDIMLGRIVHPDAVPPMRSFQVKVFVCSTPTDMEEERSAVMGEIVPKLVAYAREKWGLEFHYVDLRWGNGHAAADDYDTREFVMKELLRCQQLSAGLNFVAFVGQKYGRRRPPLLVTGEAFEILRRMLHEHRGRGARGASLLDKWYRRDANSAPPLYVLLQPQPPRGGDAATQATAAPPQQSDSRGGEPPQQAAPEAAGGVSGGGGDEDELEKLMQVMQYGVKLCCEEGSLPATAMRDYFTSDYEKELKQGTSMERSGEEALVFVRTIEDLLNYVSERRAATFADVEWDAEAQRWRQSANCATLLASLVDRAVRQRLPASAVHDFGILWRYDSGVHPVLHRPYIADLCNTFHKSLLAAIDSAAAATDFGGGTGDFAGERRLSAELLAHWRHAAAVGRHCVGRESVLTAAVNYITSREPDAEPLVIYGEPGVGKTTVMAALALELQKLPLVDAIVVPRFVGLSRSSSHLMPLLYGVCQQIRHALRLPGHERSQQLPLADDGDEDIPMGGDWSILADYWRALLRSSTSAASQRTIVVLIDGVDLLSSRDGAAAAARMRWLPLSLGPNVRIVVSASSATNSDALGRLRNELLRRHRDSFVEVRPPPTAEASFDLVSGGGLRLSSAQRAALLAALGRRGTPLNARLLLAEAARWRSFDECSLPPAAAAPAGGNSGGADASAVAGYVAWLFDRLERRHGRVVVSRALSYLTASEHGLSDLEMDELLSADDAAVAAAATCCAADVSGGGTESLPSACSSSSAVVRQNRRRMPPYVWARLRDDLDAHLTLRELDELNVYCWSHACLADGARSRYLADPAVSRAVHSAMADYYLERWMRQRSSAAAAAAAADSARRSSVNGHSGGGGSRGGRLLASREAAAATAVAAAAIVRPSVRVYERLPAHLRGAERLDELAALVVFNYEWLHSKARDASLLAAVCDVRLLAGIDARLLEKTLSGAARRLLAAGAAGADGLSPELVGRLLPHARRHPATLGRLVVQCESLGAAAHCALVPAFAYPSAPGNRLRLTIECSVDSDDDNGEEDGPLSMWTVGGGGGSQLLVKMASSPAVRLFDAASGQLRRTFVTSVGRLYVPPPPASQRSEADDYDSDGGRSSSSGGEHSNIADDGPRFVVVVDDEADRSIKVHDGASGAFLGQFIPGNHCGGAGGGDEDELRVPKRAAAAASASASPSAASGRPQQRIDAVCITRRHACLVVGSGAEAGSSSHLCVCALPSCQPLKVARLDGRANVACAAPNGRYVLCTSGGAVVAYRLSPSGGGACERVDATPVDGRPLCIAVAASSATAFAASSGGASGGGGGCVVTVMHVSPASGRAQMVTKIALRDRLGGGGVEAGAGGGGGGVAKLVPSNSDGLLAVVGARAVLVYSTALDKLAFAVHRPASSPAEFRLPGRPFAAPVSFADVAFTPDDRHLACAILREVQVWSVRRGVAVRILRGPTIGFVGRLLALAGGRGGAAAPLVATAVDGSSRIHVWDIGSGEQNDGGAAGDDDDDQEAQQRDEAGGGEVQPADRLPGPIARLRLTPDGALCFASRDGGDEVGVFDAGSGRLLHLLTHEGAAVVDVVTSANGAYALVSLAPPPPSVERRRRSQQRQRRQLSPPAQAHFAVLWHVERRRELRRLGAAPGVGVALVTRSAFVHFAPRTPDFQAPYAVTQLTVVEGDAASAPAVVRETEAPFALSHVVGVPFVTADDKYLVALTAERYDEREARHIRPSLLAFELHASGAGDAGRRGGAAAALPCRLYGERELGYFASAERTILEARPIRHVADQAVAIYALRLGGESGEARRSLGFFVLDLHRGAVLRCSDSLGSPEASTAVIPSDLHFSAGGVVGVGRGGLCLDARRGVAYSTVTGEPLAVVGNAGVPVRLACDGAAAIYCRRRGCSSSDDEVVAERLRDGRVIARCPVDGAVTCMEVGSDEQTVVLGCADGGVLAYALVDDAYCDAAATLAAVRNRRRRSGRSDADNDDDAGAEPALRWDCVVPPPSLRSSANEEGASGRASAALPPLVRSRSTSAAYATPPDRERLTTFGGATMGQSGRPRTSNGYAANGEGGSSSRGGGGGGVVVGIGGYTTLDRAVLLSRASSKACLLM